MDNPPPIARPHFAQAVRQALARARVATILGPRQCGKTTLAKMIAGQEAHFFDLEDPADRMRLETAPKTVLAELTGLVVIDEVQTLPELFPILRVLADRRPLRTKFLLLGSASPGLIRGVSESLAGRVEFIDLGGFDVDEVGSEHTSRLWVRGGFPESFLSASEEDSFAWRQGFIRTFLERDLNAFGFRLPPERLRRFWTMVAHYHGQTWNAAPIAQSLGVDGKTVAHYLDVLTGAFVLRRLQPWYENVGKRVVKAPKIYIRDSGILHGLLNLRSLAETQAHPKLGASWEGFAMEHVIRYTNAERDAYYWRVHGGAEMDLLIMRGGKRYGFEFKFADAVRPTRSLHSAARDLKLDRVFIVYPGDASFPLEPDAEAVAFRDLKSVCQGL